MSYQVGAASAARQPDLDRARGSPASPPGPWKSADGDSAYVRDSKRARQLAAAIQQSAADILREAAALGTSSSCAGGKKKVSEALKSARANQEEAKRVLENLPVAGGGGTSEVHHRRLTQQKLGESVADAYTAVRDASKQYEAAERERKKRDDAAAAAVLRPPTGLELAEAELGQQRQVRAQELDALAQAEVETHAAIAEEYAEEAARLDSNVRQMNQVVVDMARITTEQGETVNNILSFMESAADSAQGASEQLTQTNAEQQRGTKRILQMMAAAVLLVGLIVIVVIVKHH